MLEKKDKKGLHLNVSFHDWRVSSAVGLIIGIVILFVNFQFFSSKTFLFVIMNLVAAIIALVIPVYIKYAEHSKIKKIEEFFPDFLRDLTASINTGMTLPQAIRNVAKNEYSVLTPYVRDMSSKIDWGVSFEKVLHDFAKKTNSKVIHRTVRGIIEAHRSGGKIATVLGAISDSVKELETIKKERSTRVYSQMVTGYMIFFFFLAIMFAMVKFLIPTFLSGGSFQGTEEYGTFFNEMFRNLVIIQGVFSGIAIGKMAEGSIVAGFKHSFFLAIIGYTVLAI